MDVTGVTWLCVGLIERVVGVLVVAFGVGDVACGEFGEFVKLGIGHGSDEASGDAEDHVTIGYVHALGDDGTGTDEALLADGRAIEDGRAHADQ